MKIAIGSDHAGLQLKEEIKRFLESQQIECHDLGTETKDSVDYPDYAAAVTHGVVKGEYDRGILVCGTGIGMSIAANKVPGIRAALCADHFSAKASREHNDANVLCLGERVIGAGVALEIVDIWIKTEFSGGRHQKRLDKIIAMERGIE